MPQNSTEANFFLSYVFQRSNQSPALRRILNGIIISLLPHKIKYNSFISFQTVFRLRQKNSLLHFIEGGCGLSKYLMGMCSIEVPAATAAATRASRKIMKSKPNCTIVFSGLSCTQVLRYWTVFNRGAAPHEAVKEFSKASHDATQSRENSEVHEA